MIRHAVVTGVSSGIGRAIAGVLAEGGWHVFGSVRSEADAAAFEAALPGADAVLFDLTDRAAIAREAERIAGLAGPDGLTALVNNAGIAVAGPLEHVSLDRFREQLEINLVGTLAVTQAFLPLLGAEAPRARPGRIVNISSMSGRTALPFSGPYATSKFALEGLSESLRRELRVHGIAVVSVVPAAVATPIWEKAAAGGTDAYAGTAYHPALTRMLGMALALGAGGLPAEAVGRVVLKALAARRPRARYYVSRTPVTSFLMRHLPPRLLDPLVARAVGIRRQR